MIVFLFVIWFILFIVGLIINLIENKKDIPPKKTVKKYSVGISSHISKLNFPINFFLVSLQMLGLGILGLLLLNKSFLVGLIGFGIIIMALFLGYFSLMSIVLHLQYAIFEKNRVIECDPILESITIINLKDNSKEVLLLNEIKSIELYHSNSIKSMTDYEIVVFNTSTGKSHMITSLQTKIFNLAYFFKGIKRQHCYKRFNWIKQTNGSYKL